jgi:hypothetical protein
MVLVELLPEAFGQAKKPTVATLASASLVAMVVFQKFI